MKRYWFGFVCLLALLLCACGGEIEQSSPSPTTSLASNNLHVEIKAIGDIIDVDDWSIQIGSISYTEMIEHGSSGFTPKEGYVYAQFEFTVKNNSDQQRMFCKTKEDGQTIVIRVLDDQNYEYNARRLLGYPQDLHEVAFDGDKQMQGIITIQIPKKKNQNSTEDYTLSILSGQTDIHCSFQY